MDAYGHANKHSVHSRFLLRIARIVLAGRHHIGMDGPTWTIIIKDKATFLKKLKARRQLGDHHLTPTKPATPTSTITHEIKAQTAGQLYAGRLRKSWYGLITHPQFLPLPAPCARLPAKPDRPERFGKKTAAGKSPVAFCQRAHNHAATNSRRQTSILTPNPLPGPTRSSLFKVKGNDGAAGAGYWNIHPRITGASSSVAFAPKTRRAKSSCSMLKVSLGQPHPVRSYRLSPKAPADGSEWCRHQRDTS